MAPADPNAELLHWAQVLKLKKLVYDVEFRPDAEIMKQVHANPRRFGITKIQEEASAQVDPLHEALCERALELKEFTFEQLTQDSGFMETAQAAAKATGHELAWRLARYLRRLLAEGLVYVASDTETSEQDVYRTVSQDNLGVLILEYLDAQSRQSRGTGWEGTEPPKRLALDETAEAEDDVLVGAADHSHEALASEVAKRRLSRRSAAPAVKSSRSLSSKPMLLLPRPKARPDRAQQIAEFFAAPLPVLVCGPDDEGELLFGAIMEYQLRSLVNADLGGDICNLAGWVDDPHPLIDHAVEISLHNQSRSDGACEDDMNFPTLSAWGRTASQFEKVWDGTLKELYNKKHFLSCGLYAETAGAQRSKLSVYYSDVNFQFPLPSGAGQELISTARDFDLSFDLYQLIELSGGVKGCHGRGFGIQTSERIAKGSFILEYKGEIINTATCLDRMNNVYSKSSNHYFLSYGPQEVIDGYLKGTIARTVDGEFRIGLFSLKDIPPGTELTYDYQFESFGPLQKCLCQSANCRGFIGLNKKDEREPVPPLGKKSKKTKPVLKQPLHRPKQQKQKREDRGAVEDDVSDQYIVFCPLRTVQAVQAAVRSAKTSFARGSFLIRNLKQQLPKYKSLLLPSQASMRTRSLDCIVEDLFIEQADLPHSTFVVTWKGSRHFSALDRDPRLDPGPILRRLYLKRNLACAGRCPGQTAPRQPKPPKSLEQCIACLEHSQTENSSGGARSAEKGQPETARQTPGCVLQPLN
ncbi:histone methyltransferase set2 [Kappamyces sp. JEL0680]|nr:histone methyltransferase set2 [Kappamyces sp. JEL0680]